MEGDGCGVDGRLVMRSICEREVGVAEVVGSDQGSTGKAIAFTARTCPPLAGRLGSV